MTGGRIGAALAPIAVALMLSGCQGHSDAERVGEILYHKVLSVGGADEVPRERVVAIPYATLGVQLGSSDQAMFVLTAQTGDDFYWVGGTQFALATRNGRIVRSAGFPHNVSSVTADSSGSLRAYRYDLPDINAYAVVVSCTVRDLGGERIVILDIAHDTRHIVEECEAPQLSWDFTNEYWQTGDFVWRSVQYIHPGEDPITLETLRPAG